MRGEAAMTGTARKVYVFERLFQLAYPFNHYVRINRPARTVRGIVLPKNNSCVSASYLFVV
jgi:hypothetical protein